MLRTVFITLFLSFATLATAVADTPLTYDRINLSVSAGSDVENDTLVAVMYAQQEGSDAATHNPGTDNCCRTDLSFHNDLLNR